MTLLVTTIGLSMVGSLGGLVIASALLLVGESLRAQFVPGLISYAVGTLLGVSLLALLPEALVALNPPPVLGTLLAGILSFFMLEKLVIWRHCHTGECEVHDSSAALILVNPESSVCVLSRPFLRTFLKDGRLQVTDGMRLEPDASWHVGCSLKCERPVTGTCERFG